MSKVDDSRKKKSRLLINTDLFPWEQNADRRTQNADLDKPNTGKSRGRGKRLYSSGATPHGRVRRSTISLMRHPSSGAPLLHCSGAMGHNNWDANCGQISYERRFARKVEGRNSPCEVLPLAEGHVTCCCCLGNGRRLAEQ